MYIFFPKQMMNFLNYPCIASYFIKQYDCFSFFLFFFYVYFYCLALHSLAVEPKTEIVSAMRLICSRHLSRIQLVRSWN